jgi:peptidoglycan/xylan/chitin deacetylase (PgdA/CDA1 family)
LLIVVVAVLFWIAGCATGRSISMGLSAIVPSVEKGGETLQGGTAGGLGGTDGAGGNLSGVGGSGGTQSGSSGHGSNGGGVIVGGAGGGGTSGTPGTGNSGAGNGDHAGGDSPAGPGGGKQPVNGTDKPTETTRPTETTKPTETTRPTETTKPTSPTAPPGSGEGKKYVALTFDDGPDANYTTAILDILKEKGVKATFFVVGQQVSKYPEVLRRIADEGHAIGNHTENHKDLKKQGKAGILEQIGKTDEAIKEVLGEAPALFRAPYGSLSDTLLQVLKDEGRHHTGWTVDTEDWAGTSVADMREMIIHDTKPGGIILMHSFGGKHIKNTVTMLPDVIDDLRNLGYTLVTVNELPKS